MPSVRVQGEVLLDGEPVPLADVRVAARPGSAEVIAMRTDDRGRFDFGYLDPLPIHVVARAAEFRGERAVDLADHVMPGRAWLTVALEPCGHWMTGRVTDPSGRPLADVPLQERMEWTPVEVEAGRSGPDGRFAVCAHDLVAGSGSLGEVNVLGGGNDVILPPTFTVRGRVVGSDGTGVAGAIVNISPQSGGGAPVEARSGRDGEWSTSVAAGCVALRAYYRAQYGSVDKPGPPRECFGPEPLAICGDPGQTAVAPPIVLHGNPGTTRGVVRVGGKPAPGLVVTVGYQRDLTDHSGHFAFENAAGPIDVAGHAVASSPEATGADVFLEIDATPLKWIHGRVTMGGLPVAGARVRIGDEPNYVYRVVAVTTRDGSYSAQVAPGTIFIGADGPAGISSPSPEPGYLIDRPDARIDLELGAPSSLQGSVHSEDGSAPRVHLLLYRSPTLPVPVAEAHSDARGFFQMAPRPGRYWLELGHFSDWRFTGGHEQMEIVVPEHGALDLDLTVMPASEGQAGAEAEE